MDFHHDVLTLKRNFSAVNQDTCLRPPQYFQLLPRTALFRMQRSTPIMLPPISIMILVPLVDFVYMLGVPSFSFFLLEISIWEVILVKHSSKKLEVEATTSMINRYYPFNFNEIRTSYTATISPYTHKDRISTNKVPKERRSVQPQMAQIQSKTKD